MLTTDFITNVYISMKIAWLNKTNTTNEAAQIELLIDLIIAELVEFTVPLVYLLSVYKTYVGPNAHLYGNIGNGYWQFNEIEDIGETVKNILIFWGIDALSLIIGCVILWKVCRINLYRAFIVLQQEFGVLFGINLTMLMTAASKQFIDYN